MKAAKGEAALKLPMTAAEALAWEGAQDTRHEDLRGEVCAKTGAVEPHVTVTGNVRTALRQHLRVEAADACFYPDVCVTCSAADAAYAADPRIQREPLRVADVLSPSTAARDRGDKFAAYRQLPTLPEDEVLHRLLALNLARAATLDPAAWNCAP